MDPDLQDVRRGCLTYGFDVRGFLGDVHHALYCREEHVLEVHLWCCYCVAEVETSDDLHCGCCGLEIADQAPAQFYAGVS